MMLAAIATEDYEFIRRLVYEHSRINLGSDKIELVRSRVQKRLRALGLDDFEAYCRRLDSPEGEEELTALLDVISTNVTHFFREYRHFEYLQESALPEWQRARGSKPGTALRIWSAACSSGEEPYSIAILLAEFFRGRTAPDWQITATDISTRMLATAEQGIYQAERVKLPVPKWLPAYFQKGTGSWEGCCRVKSSLRQRVAFRRLNLIEWPYPFTEKFDLIFCRNVMIYFDRETQEQLVPRLVERLAPGGHLLVGHSESLIGIEHRLKTIRPSIYRYA
jgi:chemotaxis protein methyltransferase CheR